MAKYISRRGFLFHFSLCLLLCLFPTTATSQDVNKALLKAAESGNANEVQALVSQKADLETTDDSGKTPLIIASERGHIQVVAFLLKQGANVNAAATINDFTALMGAVNGEHVDAIKVLLSSGANINAKNRYGHTALTYAQRGRNQKIIQILKEAGAAE